VGSSPIWVKSNDNKICFPRKNLSMSLLRTNVNKGNNKITELRTQYSDFVKQSLLDAGFLINEDKSSFNPVRILEWLGITWDSSSFALSIPDRRIKFNDLLSSLEHILFVKYFIFNLNRISTTSYITCI
jgi:hypothetical protein